MINIYDYIVNIMANSKAARMVIFSGASPSHGLKGNTGSGGGVKKGGGQQLLSRLRTRTSCLTLSSI